MLSRQQRVFQQANDCHWANAARDGRNVTAQRRHLVELDIAFEFEARFGLG